MRGEMPRGSGQGAEEQESGRCHVARAAREMPRGTGSRRAGDEQPVMRGEMPRVEWAAGDE